LSGSKSVGRHSFYVPVRCQYAHVVEMMVRVAAERDALALGGQDVPDAGGDDMVEVADGGSDGDEENEWGRDDGSDDAYNEDDTDDAYAR